MRWPLLPKLLVPKTSCSRVTPLLPSSLNSNTELTSGFIQARFQSSPFLSTTASSCSTTRPTFTKIFPGPPPLLLVSAGFSSLLGAMVGHRRGSASEKVMNVVKA